jgi:hypothetical protein
MVEVFKTSVNDPEEAKQLLERLNGHFPQSKINFDLEDSDNILRFEARNVNTPHIINILTGLGYACDVLE